MDTKQRLIELLAERAVLGLDPEQSQELEALLDAHPEWDNDSFDLAAAAVDEALATPAQPLPTHLRDRLLVTAGQFTANSSASKTDSEAHAAIEAQRQSGSASDREAVVVSLDAERERRDRSAADASRSGSAPGWAGWVAAAAALILAALAWWPSAPVPGAAPDSVALRAQLLSDAGDAQQLPWQTTPDPAAVGASGDVVWSGVRQEGYMRIRGLTANDPALDQYQLWIFDAQRDERFPVDGGVFDVPAGSQEVVVPIRAKLPVDDPILFAVTVERPGGVVVSDRERIVLLAQEAAEGN
jgi:hypothetical protein